MEIQSLNTAPQSSPPPSRDPAQQEQKEQSNISTTPTDAPQQAKLEISVENKNAQPSERELDETPTAPQNNSNPVSEQQRQLQDLVNQVTQPKSEPIFEAQA